jgi:general secretion pathway protein G
MIRSKNFTLIELIVVIAIIAVLAAIVTPNAFRTIQKAKIARTAADLKAVKAATLVYRADTGSWPSSNYIMYSRNHELLVNPGTVVGWDGPYLEKEARSPLARPPGTGGLS